MTTKTQSVIDRIDTITADLQRKRFSLARIALFMNEAQSLIAEAKARASSQWRPFTLVAGARQDLRSDSATQWIRLHDVLCNADPAGAPVGATMRQVSRAQLDAILRTWRAATASTAVFEFSLDEREPFAFDVYPPAVAGSKVYLLASVRPAPVCVLNGGGTALADADEVIGLNDGFDIPMVDWVLYRLFSRDASDAAYVARARDHLAAAQLALGVVLKDAAP